MTDGKQPGLFDDLLPPTVAGGDAALVIRPSRRARHLTLRFVPPHTLELVVPPRVRAQEVEAFVKAQHRWIEEAKRQIAQIPPNARATLPETLDLRALDTRMTVRYRHVPGVRPSCRARGNELTLVTPDCRHAAAPHLLRTWVRRQGLERLVPWLQQESARIGLTPQRVQVRLQRTRWGSCSSRGLVSLNAALLFVEPELVSYLFVHELCHLRHLNHSSRYWQLVARFEPDYEQLDRRLACAWSGVPWWLYARR